MRKLVLIAAMLLLPAIAFGVDLCVTDFEDASYGAVDGQTIGGAPWWTPWWHGSNEASIIDDPTGGSKGKVLAVHTTNIDENVETTGVVVDNPGGGITRTKGYKVLEVRYYLYGNPAHSDWTNVQAMEWGPTCNDYFMDDTDTIEAWTGGSQWDPFAGDLTTQVLAPVRINEWFTVKLVFDVAAMTYDYYIGGWLAGNDLPTYNANAEDNYLQMKFYLLDPFQSAGDAYLLLDRVKWTYSVPEPSIFALAGLGLLPLLRRRKK